MVDTPSNSRSNLLRDNSTAIEPVSTKSACYDPCVAVWKCIPRTLSIDDDDKSRTLFGCVDVTRIKDACPTLLSACLRPGAQIDAQNKTSAQQSDASVPKRKSFLNCWNSVSKDSSTEMQIPSNSMEPLMRELFRLQDLNGNNVLEEEELIKLNEKIAMLHYGKNTDRVAVQDRFRDIFRSQLNASGEPASYTTFRNYMADVLEHMDPGDIAAQEMILEQYINEAKAGRCAFHMDSFSSASDAPWLPRIASDVSKPDALLLPRIVSDGSKPDALSPVPESPVPESPLPE